MEITGIIKRLIDYLLILIQIICWNLTNLGEDVGSAADMIQRNSMGNCAKVTVTHLPASLYSVYSHVIILGEFNVKYGQHSVFLFFHCLNEIGRTPDSHGNDSHTCYSLKPGNFGHNGKDGFIAFHYRRITTCTFKIQILH